MKKLIGMVLALVICLSTLTPLTVFANPGNGILPSGIPYSGIEAAVDAYAKAHKSTTAAVSTAVFTRNKVLMEKAYGYTDLEKKLVNDKDSVFEWGSCTKLLVWISAMQLVEQGKLHLDQDIRTYLPKGFFKKLKFDTPITMLNLMNHNAGWQETVTDLFLQDSKDVRELGAALRLIEPEQVHAPGKVVAYSNWGAGLAGYIVERISGKTFDQYVHENIFKPLGMDHTALNPTLSDNPWVAKKRQTEKCYMENNQSLGINFFSISLYPAGMATGTLSDFLKFGQAFLGNKDGESSLFEKKKTLKQMFTPTLFYADGKTARNCHGFWTDQLGVPVLWHDGGTMGSSSWFALDPKSGTGSITLTNQWHESVYNCGLLPLVFGKYKSVPFKGDTKDISGMYITARTSTEGFAKPYSLFSMMRLDSDGKGKFTVPGTDSKIIAIGKDSYLLGMGQLKQFVIHAAVDEDGKKILQMPGADNLEVNGLGVKVEYGLLAMFIVAALYSFVALVISPIRYLITKKAMKTIDVLRAAVNGSVIAVTILFVYVSIQLFSGIALINEIRWSLILIAVFAIVPVIYAGILALQWKKLSSTRSEKMRLILTGVTGLIITINVLFWQSYKFW